MKFLGLINKSCIHSLAALTLGLSLPTAFAGTLTGGTFNVTYNNNDDLLAGLSLGPGATTAYYVAGFFDKSSADTYASAATMLAEPDFDAPATLTYQVNPSDLTGTGIPSGSGGRNNQTTSLTWDASQDALLDSSTFIASGQVGLNGVVMTRGSFTGSLLSGDYSFEYVDSRNDGTNSGWTLYNNVSFRSSSYDARNLNVTTVGDQLIMTGELWWSTNTSAFLFGGDGSTSAGQAGTFSLMAPATVPVPAAAWLLGSGLIGLWAAARRKPLAATPA